MRFFRATYDAYESARNAIDAAFGYAPGTGTDTSITPAESAPRAPDGLVYVAISDAGMAEIAAGMMDEIDEDTYRGVLPQVP